MKDYNATRNEVIAALRSMLPDTDVKLETIDVVKINDIYQYGIIFRDGNVGMTFYINDYIAAEKSVHEIADEMLVAFENSVEAPPYHFVQDILAKQQLDDLKDNLFVAVIEKARNEAYLKSVPYQEIGNGFAFICQFRHTDTSGTGLLCSAVTQQLADTNGWNTEKLFEIAITNTMESDPPVLCTMQDNPMRFPWTTPAEFALSRRRFSLNRGTGHGIIKAEKVLP